jgi:hypothetical protein
MPDLTPRPASSATPPSPPRTPGWVKLGTGLAVIGAEITESVLHPAAAEALGIADAAIPLIVGLILFTTIVRGSPQTAERIFRLLRWIANRPEPTAPGSPSSQSPAAAAEHPSAQETAGISPAPSANPAPSAGNDLTARQAAALHEFDVPPQQGLSRAQASAAFEKHGMDPRSFGSWVQRGYLAREENRRWLTDKGREWADSKSGGAARVRQPTLLRQASSTRWTRSARSPMPITQQAASAPGKPRKPRKPGRPPRAAA